MDTAAPTTIRPRRPREKGAKSLDPRPRDGRYEAAAKRAGKKGAPKKKFANTRTALQKTKDYAFIARWRHYGHGLDALREKLNAELEQQGREKLSRAQVAADLAAVEKAWREERQYHVEHLRDKDLARLESDEAQLLEAWEASKTGVRKTKVKQGGGEGGKVEKTFETVSGYGDPSIMAQILRIRELRAKICGWLQPQRHEHSGPDGAPLPMTTAAPIINVTIAPPPKDEP